MSATATSQGDILSRVLLPDRGDVPPEVARWLLRVEFGPSDRERIAALDEKGREGALSEAEDAELEVYRKVGRLLEILRLKARVALGSQVREKVEEEAVAYGGIIVADPPPARIRRSAVTVGDILGWLADGQSEEEILGRHTELQSADIRASLAYVADREKRRNLPPPRGSFTDRWTGKFTLPAPDPEDARLTFLLERYLRNR
jgi:uncharacterized protein (DUF433 family)